MLASTSTDWRRRIVGLLCLTILTGACQRHPEAFPPPVGPPAPRSTPAPAAAPPHPSAELAASFESLVASIPAKVSLTVAAGTTLQQFGSADDGPAWSTIKVPLAIAALRSAPDQASGLVHAAITRSDNAAAEELWALLGTPTESAQAVQTVLEETGDNTTRVQMNRVRAGFTPFGQTHWPLEAQARFAWRLHCVRGAEPVIEDMQHLVPDQRWGLATDEHSATKGGWGPQPSGEYLVRQIASITDDAGSIGVAIAALANDGSYESGVSAVDDLARWVLDHRDAFKSEPC